MRKIILAFFSFTTPLYPIALIAMSFGDYELFWENHTPLTLFFLAGYYYVLFEFDQCEQIKSDDKLFWSWVTNAILLPAIYFKIINSEQQTESQNNKRFTKEQPPAKLSPLNHSLTGFFCFAIPLYLFSVFFGLTPYLQLLGQKQHYLRGVLFAGFIYVMIMFWRSARFTNDDKLFWTIGILFSAPIGLPLLYFRKIRHSSAEYDAKKITTAQHLSRD